jgi:hypothetical protein
MNMVEKDINIREGQTKVDTVEGRKQTKHVGGLKCNGQKEEYSEILLNYSSLVFVFTFKTLCYKYTVFNS